MSGRALYLQQLILCGVGELCMEAVLQNFSYVSHAIATCSNTKQHGGTSNTNQNNMQNWVTVSDAYI